MAITVFGLVLRLGMMAAACLHVLVLRAVDMIFILEMAAVFTMLYSSRGSEEQSDVAYQYRG